jgi:TetR/AcrR family transcriptional regulator
MVNPHHKEGIPTQQKILDSAREIFIAKGMDGARMQEIADHAGINKALLHYYFRNKETLFRAVFQQAMKELLPAMTEVFTTDRPLLEKIPDFFSVHMGFIQANPMIPQFILTELTRNPDMLMIGFRAIKDQGLFDKFTSEVNESIRNGEIKPVDSFQLIINLLSLSIFPFIAKPVLMRLFSMDESQFENFLENRKTEVTKFVISALK